MELPRAVCAPASSSRSTTPRSLNSDGATAAVNPHAVVTKPKPRTPPPHTNRFEEPAGASQASKGPAPPPTPGAVLQSYIAQRKKETAASFADIAQETTLSAHFAFLKERDSDALDGPFDWVAYHLENAIAADKNVPFYVLLGTACFCILAVANMWTLSTEAGKTHDATHDFYSASFFIFQLLFTGGFDDSIAHFDQRLIFTLAIIIGVTLISILVGLITDSVNGYMRGMSEGSSKVVEHGHTLILGWNESTTRVICQIAFLRHTFLSQNRTWARTLFPWLRVKPSSPVAASPVIIMTNMMRKTVMEEHISSAFRERNVNPKMTKIGRDVVFRKGDPCKAHDLVRVAAHRATSVLIMMTEVDLEEQEESAGATENSATIRCLLSLRNVIYSNGKEAAAVTTNFPAGLRVVCQLSSPCVFLHAAAIIGPDERSCVHALDLHRTINVMLFQCGAKPGLSRVVMQLYNFEGTSIRCRDAYQLRGGHGGSPGWFVGKTMRAAQLGCGWWNGVLIGVADTTFGTGRVDDDKEDDFAVHGGGVCGDPHRVIQHSDVLIFVSPTSSPSPFPAHRKAPAFKAEATAILKKMATDRGRFAWRRSGGSGGRAGQQPAVQERQRSATIESQTDRSKRGAPQHVLLCGWRHEWSTDISRFKQRFVDICVGLSPGSSVTCLNVMACEDFDQMLLGSKKGFERLAEQGGGQGLGEGKGTDRSAAHEGLYEGGWVLNDGDPHHARQCHGVVVRHHHADPIKFDEVAPLLESRDFDTAIVLGSVVARVIPAASRDARVLSCLLILRALAKPEKPMHIIAENCMDQTSGLAVVPSRIRSSGGHEPDFINTQAIIARCLVMNLAYPQIQDALTELILQEKVAVDFVAPADLGIEGLRATFGAVQFIVCAGQVVDGYAAAIGYFNGPMLVMCPDPREHIEWTSACRVIILVRDVTPDDEEEPVKEGKKKLGA